MPAVAVEMALVALLMVVLFAQLLSYPVTPDPDSDSHAAAANELLASDELAASASRRLSGYLLFLAAVDSSTAGPLAEAVYRVQLGMMLVFSLALWAWVRWRFGALPALSLLGILAAPCYFTRTSVVMLPDAPYSMLMLPFLLAAGWWTLAPAPRGGWLWLPVFGLALLALQALRPTTVVLVAVLLPALLIGRAVGRRLNPNEPLAPSWAVLGRGAALVAACLLMLVVTDRPFDAEARQRWTDQLGFRIVMTLPPVSANAAEQRIEEAKRQFAEIEGRTIEETPFGSYAQFRLDDHLRREDVREVWAARLIAHPGRYLIAVVDDLRQKHFVLARLLLPYFLESAHDTVAGPRYPRDDGSPAGDLFQRTGLVVLDRKVRPDHAPVLADAIIAVLQLVAVWGLVGIGAWRTWHWYGARVIALLIAALALVLVVAATLSLDARTLLPFAVPVYVLQAIAIAWMVQAFSRLVIEHPVGRPVEPRLDADGRDAGAAVPVSRTRPVLLELLVVGLLMGMLLAQLLSYPATADVDPDGYVSHANGLLATGQLPPSRRLPGYPLFLALVDSSTAGPLAEAVYRVQLGMMLVFSLALWAWTRWRFGVLPALCLLGIFAAPCYFTRMSVVMLPDVPYSMLMLPFLLTVGWWTLAAAPRGGWLWLPVFGLAVLGLHAIRPTTVLLVAVLLPTLLVGRAVSRWLDRPERLAPPGVVLRRIGALVGALMLVLVVSDRYLDTGSREFNTALLRYRVVMRVPPASDSDVERRIEEAKQRFTAIEGESIDDARFATYRRFATMEEIPLEDAAQVWQARLLAHPIDYLLSVVEDLRLGHHLLARRYVPYYTDVAWIEMVLAYYPRNDGSAEGNLFRRTGLITMDREPIPSHAPLRVETTFALLQLLSTWGLLLIGIWRVWRRDGAMVIALGLTFVLFMTGVAATNTVDFRYVLPFATPIYLGQALGVAWLAEWLVRRSGTRGARPEAVTMASADPRYAALGRRRAVGAAQLHEPAPGQDVLVEADRRGLAAVDPPHDPPTREDLTFSDSFYAKPRKPTEWAGSVDWTCAIGYCGATTRGREDRP